MSAANRTFADKPTLRGQLVTLRPVETEDVPVLAGILRDPEVRRLTGSVHSTAEASADDEEEARLREWYSTRNDQPDRLDLMVVDHTSGQVVGEVVLNQWDEGSATCNFRTLIGPAGRDRGLGTEAARLLMDYAFTHLPLHRIDLEVYAFNPRAQRVYEKVGFVVEGRRREALQFDGQRVDAIIMGLLRSDWDAPRDPMRSEVPR
ncbi:GNAT family N-acetyltransferase [Ornithinimicrobium cryptoxanthini]|uniref:GNAT family N-acetyltransferase n=1 Tax=Ornithinimicrobium cryptoxanthini TaxID=2934161 RepID=A0ABY4YMC7_9MICO|nr:GNAT family protein [Ornithinimicrobium cryptoxanthini]USQ77307.1 GNAT family N-acetyltransferase [Ornithinimicrobium cryptoxanthini]